MTEEPIPVAVVGAGNMGSNHARVFNELPDAELVEVIETDEERAAEISAAYDVDVLGRAEDIEHAEAATVAVPNHLHRSVAETLFESGLDLLVEKPVAMTVEDAKAIVAAAEVADAVLQVGHIERFNPAVETLQKILADEELIAIEAHRLGPFNEQLSMESVVFDLMIHDLDIVDYLVDEDLAHLDAIGRRFRSSEPDHAVTTLQYEDSVLATTVASHVTHTKVRRLDVTTRDAYIELDYQAQSLDVQRRGVDQVTSFEGSSGYRTETITETPFVQTREPLKNELEHFLECVRKRREPRIQGSDGVAAVRRAQAVVEAMTASERT